MKTDFHLSLPQYQCHKVVRALRIQALHHKSNPDESGRSAASSYGAFITPVEDAYVSFDVSAEYMSKHRPEVGGYYVLYDDGYESYSPAAAFEAGYSKLSRITAKAQCTAGMSFGQALEALQSGQRIARTSWNGKGMFVYLVPAASYPVQAGGAKAHFGEGAMVLYNPYFAIKSVDETVSTWVPSVNDCLAADWVIVGQAVPGHQQRVLNEKMELDLRISALDPFIDRNPIFASLPVEEQARLKRQLDVMHELSSILGERIANF